MTLGNSGIRVTRLAFGTGSWGGKVQRELGQERFTRLVRHAYDRGIRFFETADAYSEMHEMLAIALRGLPRDSYRLMTKMRVRGDEEPKATIDRFRKELESEYFDILLLHCVRVPDWATQYERLRDALSEAKDKKVILAHGASCHGLLPLRAFPANTSWLDVALLRVNPVGTRMDGRRIEGVDWLAELEHDVVGHVHDVADRALAGGEQPHLDDVRRGSDRHPAHPAARESGAQVGVMDLHGQAVGGGRPTPLVNRDLRQSDLLLALWRRHDPLSLHVDGDPAVLEGWPSI